MFDIVRSKARVRNFRIVRNETGTKYKVQSSGLLRAWKTITNREFTGADGSIDSIERARQFKTTLVEKAKEESWQSMGEREVE